MSIDPAIQLAAEVLTKNFEGLRLSVYQDSSGYWTIGYGTRYIPPDNQRVAADTPPISEAVALQWLEWGMQNALSTIDRLVTVPLNINQSAALIDFVYNVGAGNFESSTLLRELNLGRYDQVGPQLKRWVFSAGVKLPDLIRRRDAEAALFYAPLGGVANNGA